MHITKPVIKITSTNVLVCCTYGHLVACLSKKYWAGSREEAKTEWECYGRVEQEDHSDL